MISDNEDVLAMLKGEDSDYNNDEEAYTEKDLDIITYEVVHNTDAPKDIFEHYKLLCRRKMNNWSVLLLLPVLPMIVRLLNINSMDNFH